MSRGKVETGDEWECPPGWCETRRGLFRHTSGAICRFLTWIEPDQKQAVAWAAEDPSGALVGVYTRDDGWLDAAMAEALRP